MIGRTLTILAAGMPTIGGGAYEVLVSEETATGWAKLYTALGALLDTLRDNATADAFQSTASPAFMTFFKNIANRQIVFDALRTITNGPPDKKMTPRIVNVSGRGQIFIQRGTREQDSYDECIVDDIPSMTVEVDGDAPLIIICPITLELPVKPSMSTAPCLRVDHHFNRFIDDGIRLSNYLMWALLQALLSAYGNVLTNKVNEPNECFSLSPSAAIKNVFSWIYYTASK